MTSITTLTNTDQLRVAHHIRKHILTKIGKISFAQLLHSFSAQLADVRERNISQLRE